MHDITWNFLLANKDKCIKHVINPLPILGEGDCQSAKRVGSRVRVNKKGFIKSILSNFWCGISAAKNLLKSGVAVEIIKSSTRFSGVRKEFLVMTGITGARHGSVQLSGIHATMLRC